MRRAWVEIGLAVVQPEKLATVALHAEGVGRNPAHPAAGLVALVALHAEGVGRNSLLSTLTAYFAVALHAEGVGRNWYSSLLFLALYVSPSMRRAWVEI